MTKDIALKFNNFYGDTFIIPEVEIDKNKDLIIGIDGKKMSKSYNNTIPIFGKESQIKDQIMNIKTDSAGLNDLKDTNTPLFQIFSMFLSDNELKTLDERYNTPGLKYMEVKKELFEKVMDYFSNQRKNRDKFINNPDDVRDLMKLGAEKARDIASKTLLKVKKAAGLI